MLDRPQPSEIPDAPGAYLFRDGHGAVLYVGKAKSLRKRLAAYFGDDLAVRTRNLTEAAASVEWIVTENEVEAIHLEYTLVQRHQPRFNIRLRDDKSFPYLAITRSEEWPWAGVIRGRRRAGTQYFGPYAHAYAIRQTLDLLLRTFPVRTCSNSKMSRHRAQGRPCLLFHIERCCGPCVDAVTHEEYRAHVDGLASFLSGGGVPVIEDLRRRMAAASDAMEYEAAARLRDQIDSVEKALSRQEVASARSEDFDLIAAAGDELEAAIEVLTVRAGRVTGKAGAVVDKVEEVTTGELMASMLRERYGDERPPPEVLVQELPPEPGVWVAWLEERRGSAVSLRVPRRGGKRRLLETAGANASAAFARHRLRRQSDHASRARALHSLQSALGLPEPPLRIEAFDIATIQGTDTVGSMVVFEDGLPRRSDYRRFRVRRADGQDDFAAIGEVVERRLAALAKERDLAPGERGRFAYPPSLLLVDGGAGQVARAADVVARSGQDIPVAGLAKRMEEVYLPGRPEPVLIDRTDEGLYLLQRIRDEAHRFANSYHRERRGRRMVDSVLDGVPGIGPARKRALLREFGSLKRIGEADVAELSRLVPAVVADRLHRALNERSPDGA